MKNRWKGNKNLNGNRTVLLFTHLLGLCTQRRTVGTRCSECNGLRGGKKGIVIQDVPPGESQMSVGCGCLGPDMCLPCPGLPAAHWRSQGGSELWVSHPAALPRFPCCEMGVKILLYHCLSPV